jgi:hypothetical protein
MNLPRDLLQKTEIPEQSNGPWVIKKFEVTKDSADFYNMQQLFSGHGFQLSVAMVSNALFVKGTTPSSVKWLMKNAAACG